MFEHKLNFRMHRLMIAVVLITGQAVPLYGCNNPDRDADENSQRAGWQDRGRNPGSYDVDKGFVSTGPGTGSTAWIYELDYTDVILTPDGEFILGMAPVPGPDQGWAKPGMVLVMQDVFTGERQVFPSIMNVRRINFSPNGQMAFFLSEDGTRVSALELLTQKIVWERTFVDGQYSVLDISPDGRFIIGSNLPTTDFDEQFFNHSPCGSPSFADMSRCRIGVIDSLNDDVTVQTFALPPRDIDFSPVHDEMIVTTSTWDLNGTPEASLTFINLQSGNVVSTVTFPNCADELKIQPGGSLGLLAPTHCRAKKPQHGTGFMHDPISVIDLAARQFIDNLPGFGPVALSPDGKTAVGFTRRAEMQTIWNVPQEEAVGLIFVDLPTLDWTLLEFGPREPTYKFSSDGQFLLTYTEGVACDTIADGSRVACDDIDSELSRIDVATLFRTPFVGLQVSLDRFAEVGNNLYAIDGGQLYRIDINAALVTHVYVPNGRGGIMAGATPDIINVRPQKDYLVLGEEDAPVFYLVPLVHPETDCELVTIAL